MIYKVTASVETRGDGIRPEELFRNLQGDPVHPVDALFPIFRQHETGPWTPLGTGFFISDNGFFTTARHVLTDNYGNLLPSLVGLHVSRRDNTIMIRDVIKVTLHESADVAVGFLNDGGLRSGTPTHNYAFTLTEKQPQKGDKVTTFTIPKPAAVPSEGGAFELQFSPRLIEGVLEEHYPHGRDKILMPSHCFQSSMELEGGASGGPVFFGDGSVFGINSTGFDGEPISYLSSVSDLFDLKVREVGLATEGRIINEISVRELAEKGCLQLR